MINATPIILCGGSGSRLWPLSRTGFPKQFLNLTGNESLFQQAALRLSRLEATDIKIGSPFIVTGEEHRFLASEQLREIGVESHTLLLEPVGRNTAPALTLAALTAIDAGNDPVLVVTPADQTVSDLLAYTKAIETAIREASNGTIVILGVTPDYPETGYGYIQTAKNKNKFDIVDVKRFVEKPSSDTASAYLKEGGYYWNAGIFVLKASIWLKTLANFRPDVLKETREAWNKHSRDGTFVRPGKSEFTAIAPVSIDYAVMEHCPGSVFPIKMVPLSAGWNDLGAWDAVWKSLPKDDNGNSLTGDVLATACKNTLVHASSRLVSVVGLQNIIIIETPDAVLVTEMDHSQDIKNIVHLLHEQKREEHNLHRKVHRPWGWYDSIDEAERFKVKRILVKAGASLSLQKHYHRSEHWIVVKGTAEVTCGKEMKLVTENQSVYIPLGHIHRLHNPGKVDLEIIEIQSGSYLKEDDIIRLEDGYGRTQAQ